VPLQFPLEDDGALVAEGIETCDHAALNSTWNTATTGPGQLQLGARAGIHAIGRLNQGAARTEIDHVNFLSWPEDGDWLPRCMLRRDA
jgi:hypothetical protein